MKYNYLGTSKEKMDLFQEDWKGGIYGALTDLTGVVLHDAGAGMNATAYSVAKMTVDRMKTNSSASNYHNIIDNNGNCYAVCNEYYATYSLGDKNTNDTYYPNDHFISIEIAPSLTGGTFANQSEKDKYFKAWENACKLVADYCVKYNLSHNDVHQHREYGSTSCPYTMEKYFGSYDKALSETRAQVKKEIEALKGGSVSTLKSRELKFEKNPKTDSHYNQGNKDHYYRDFRNALVDVPVYNRETKKKSGTIKVGQNQIACYDKKRDGDRSTFMFYSNGNWHYFYSTKK